MGNKATKLKPPPVVSAASRATSKFEVEAAKRQMDVKKLEVSRENEQVISNFNALTWSIHSKDAKTSKRFIRWSFRSNQEAFPGTAKLSVQDLEGMITDRRVGRDRREATDEAASPLLLSVFKHVNTPELQRKGDSSEKGIWVDDLAEHRIKSAN
ncbi:hypothetical protein BC829DRAFT_378470 [Chytridium lagenaria]|nr:hypothetical protein BC829DRAFT_378470 [Chytridium lagenaria]